MALTEARPLATGLEMILELDADTRHAHSDGDLLESPPHTDYEYHLDTSFPWLQPSGWTGRDRKNGGSPGWYGKPLGVSDPEVESDLGRRHSGGAVWTVWG